MIKTIASSIISAVVATGVIQPEATSFSALPPSGVSTASLAMASRADARGNETISIYFSPLESTRITSKIGFGLAYHIALVYTDHSGNSYGASSGPSKSLVPKSAGNTARAMVYLARQQPSDFGYLAADPKNNSRFNLGGSGDIYTGDRDGSVFPHTLVARGIDLSAKWKTILKTYDAVSRRNLTYSPTSQNSNSLAGTALREAGLNTPFSSKTVFAPGLFTELAGN